MVLAFFSMLALFFLTAPAAVSKTIEKNADSVYDKADTFDLRLTYALGFTDSDVAALNYAECVEDVSTSSDGRTPVSADNSMDTQNVYQELYIYVAGAKERLALSDGYRSLVNNAREYIEINIAPSQAAAREQNIHTVITKEMAELNDTLDGYMKKEAELDEELVTLSENYAKAMEDFESEQKAINEAKEAIQAEERNAQSSIESGKKSLTSVLNEVYSKSVVTSEDLKRAQGLSNYVSGSEKNLHSQFTSEWSKLTAIETGLHEDEIALKENKEQREAEIALEKTEIDKDAASLRKKIGTLEARLDVEGGRWIIEDRSIMPEYDALLTSDSNMLKRYAPAGVFLCVFCLLFVTLIIVSVISKNRDRIASWKSRGLEDRIIMGLFVRRTALASVLGSFAGAAAGCLAAPVVYMYSYADILDIPFLGPAVVIGEPAAGIVAAAAVSAIACVVSYKCMIKTKDALQPQEPAHTDIH